MDLTMSGKPSARDRYEMRRPGPWRDDGRGGRGRERPQPSRDTDALYDTDTPLYRYKTEAAEELQQVTRQRAAAEENTTVGTSSIRDSEQHCVAVPDDSCFDASNTVISKVLSNLFVVRKCARTSGELAPDEEVFSSNYEHLVAACGKVENEAKPAALLDICMSTVPPPSSSDFGNRHIRAIEDPFLVSSSASASSETTPDEGVSSGDNEHLASICEEVDSDAKPDTLLDMSTVHPTASSYEHLPASVPAAMSASSGGASCVQRNSTGLRKKTPIGATGSTSFTAAPPTDNERDASFSAAPPTDNERDASFTAAPPTDNERDDD